MNHRMLIFSICLLSALAGAMQEETMEDYSASLVRQIREHKDFNGKLFEVDTVNFESGRYRKTHVPIIILQKTRGSFLKTWQKHENTLDRIAKEVCGEEAEIIGYADEEEEDKGLFKRFTRTVKSK